MEDRKRSILFVEEGRPNRQGGFGGSLFSMLELAGRLQNKHTITILTYYEVPILQKYTMENVEFKFCVPFNNFIAVEPIKNSTRRSRIYIPEWLRSDLAMLRELKTLRKIFKTLKKNKYDLVVGNNQLSGNIRSFAYSFFKFIPYIQYQRAEMNVHSPLKMLILFRTRKLVCISQYVQDSVVTRGSVLDKFIKKKSIVVYNFESGFQNRASFRASRESRIEIVWLGRIIPQKNLEDLIEISRQLKNNDLPFSVSVFGDTTDDPEYYVEISNQIDAYGLSEKIKFQGYKPKQVIFGSRATSNFLLHTTKHDKGEPFGRVLLDGILNGFVVVTSGSGGAKEVISHKSNGFIYSTPMEASDIIANFFYSEGTFEFASNAYQFTATHFDPNDETKKFDLLIENVMR